MQNNPVVWFEIYVQDMDRAKAFYESVFDVKLAKLAAPDPDIDMWSFPMREDGAGAAGALVKMSGVDSGNSGVLIYFTSTDCAVECSRVAAAGGTLIHGKKAIGEYGFMAMFMDTEGNLLGIHSDR